MLLLLSCQTTTSVTHCSTTHARRGALAWYNTCYVSRLLFFCCCNFTVILRQFCSKNSVERIAEVFFLRVSEFWKRWLRCCMPRGRFLPSTAWCRQRPQNWTKTMWINIVSTYASSLIFLHLVGCSKVSCSSQVWSARWRWQWYWLFCDRDIVGCSEVDGCASSSI